MNPNWTDRQKAIITDHVGEFRKAHDRSPDRGELIEALAERSREEVDFDPGFAAEFDAIIATMRDEEPVVTLTISPATAEAMAATPEGPGYGRRLAETLARQDTTDRVQVAAEAFAAARGLDASRITEGDDQVGHKVRVAFSEYLIVDLIASEEVDGELPGQVAWTFWDIAHDLDLGGVFGTSDPAGLVADLQKVIGNMALVHYDARYDAAHFEDTEDPDDPASVAFGSVGSADAPSDPTAWGKVPEWGAMAPVADRIDFPADDATPPVTATAGSHEWDRLAAEAVIISGTIAETLADGVLPEGLWMNEARMRQVVEHLRNAIEAMGQVDEGGR